MNKSISFFISFILVLSIFFAFYYSHQNSSTNKENVIIARVIDGDTIELNDSRHVRLLNINSPEKGKPYSNLAKEFLEQYEGKQVLMENLGKDKYHRTLGRIYSEEYLNLEIVKRGYAPKFLVNEKELSQFAKAEKDAISASKGMWNRSEIYGCITGQVSQKDEIVFLSILCNISTSGITIKDESRKSYSLPDLSVKELKIHSTEGQDNSSDLFWNSKTSIWNNDRDTLYIFDKIGNIIFSKEYGY